MNDLGTGELFIIIAIFCILWGGVCAWLAGEKGRSAGSWFVLGCLTGVFALLLLAVSPSIPRARYDEMTGERLR